MHKMTSSKEENGEEMMTVLYNTRYGGWNPSQEAIDLYDKYNLEINPHYKPSRGIYGISRYGPVAFRVWEELGDRFDARLTGVQISKTAVEKIPIKYRNHIYIDEYDGKETVGIDYLKYKADTLISRIQQVIDDKEQADSDKIREVRRLILDTQQSPYDADVK